MLLFSCFKTGREFGGGKYIFIASINHVIIKKICQFRISPTLYPPRCYPLGMFASLKSLSHLSSWDWISSRRVLPITDTLSQDGEKLPKLQASGGPLQSTPVRTVMPHCLRLVPEVGTCACPAPAQHLAVGSADAQ